MTDEELAAIRERVRSVRFSPTTWLTPGQSADLLAEVERLKAELASAMSRVASRALLDPAIRSSYVGTTPEVVQMVVENAAMREIVQVVADADVFDTSRGDMIRSTTVDAHELCEKARAILAETDQK